MIASLKRYRCMAAATSLLLALASAASAQAPYPSRSITLVLPFAAGSGTDTTTRIISKELGTALGVGMVVDNKAGANGSIAASYVARSAPDGYTLFVTTNTTHSANPFLLKNMSYDPVKDFTPIARTGDLPFMLVIHPDIPANSVAELIALAKKEPGKYSYASGSSSAIVSGATFARLAGIDLLHVPYKSSPPALTDVIAGRVSMMFVDVLTGLPHVNGKALKALAVTTKKPSALLPQLPTMDATVKGFDITSWQGYLGPANMPKEMVAKLNAEIRKVVERPEIKSPARRARHGGVLQHAGGVRCVPEGADGAVGKADHGCRDREAVGIVGWAKAHRAVPTIYRRTVIGNGGHAFALPTLRSEALRTAHLEAQNSFDPFRNPQHAMIVQIWADELQAKRKTVLAEPGRKGHGRHTE